MIMKEDFEMGDLDSLEQEEGSEFDMRNFEREVFGNLYKKLLEGYTLYTEDRKQWKIGREYFSVAKTLISSFKRYAKHDEELYEDLEWLEDQLPSLKNKCHEVEQSQSRGQVKAVNRVDQEAVDEVKELIEDMRHAGNLKMPQETTTQEEKAWQKGK